LFTENTVIGPENVPEVAPHVKHGKTLGRRRPGCAIEAFG
jgi:hypothetical protein